MDVMKKLHALLTPVNEPANHSYTRPARPAIQNQASFAETLREAAGRNEQASEVQLPTVVTRPASEAGEGSTAADTPSTDLPVTEIHIDARDTLEDIIAAEQDKLAVNDPIELDDIALDIPVSVVPDDVVGATEDADGGKNSVSGTGVTDPVTPPAAEPPSTKSTLPPIGVAWTSLLIRGTGVAADHGVNGTDGAWIKQLEFKHDQYTNPGKYNATLNTEARLFLDAVDRGYVANSPEGLGTLLGYLSKGSMGPDAKPPEIAAYFNQFFASQTTMNV